MHKCNLCKSDLFHQPLLELHNVPKSAQYFLDEEDLKTDKGIDLVIYQCSGCGVVQIKNEPVHYYKDVIRASAFSQGMVDFRKTQFKKFVDTYELKKKNFIEIGCGKGEYLSIMKNFIKNSYGLEHSYESVGVCREEGLNAIHGYIEHDILLKKYDSFAVFNFLEHIPDINNFLKGILDATTDDAIGIIEVPNFNMILHNNLFSEFIIDHLYYFTKETMTTVLESNGFSILSFEEVCDDYILSFVVQKKKRLNLNYFYDFIEDLKRDFYNHIKDHRVAIWGAGHQALTLISLLNIQDNIEFIIDSAPFKQNKFALSSHLPIISPDDPLMNVVDIIIIIAGSYNKDVEKTIKIKYTNNYNMFVIEANRLKEIF